MGKLQKALGPLREIRDFTAESERSFRPCRLPLQKLDLDARIAALESELAELRHRRRAQRDAAWLRAIAVAIGPIVFSNAELLIKYASLNPELAAALDGMSPRQIGRRLARLQGQTIGGLCLVREKQDEHGWIWELRFPC